MTFKKIWNKLKNKKCGWLSWSLFKKFCKLDPCHYFSSPGLSWDAMFKITCVKLENISDIDMYLFIAKGLRGGIFYIAKRHSKGNNKYMKNYDITKPSIYVLYLDMNNL